MCFRFFSVRKLVKEKFHDFHFYLFFFVILRHGIRGFYHEDSLPPIELDPGYVELISNSGGTILGSERGGYDIERIVEGIVNKKKA